MEGGAGSRHQQENSSKDLRDGYQKTACKVAAAIFSMPRRPVPQKPREFLRAFRAFAPGSKEVACAIHVLHIGHAIEIKTTSVATIFRAARRVDFPVLQATA